MIFNTLRKLIIAVCVLLFAQYWLGMVANLFITIPFDSPLNFFNYFDGVEVLAHIMNGILILGLALVIIVFSYKTGDSLLHWLSTLSLAFVTLAVVMGFVFMLRGQEDSFSMAMAMSFIFIYTTYFSELILLWRIRIPDKI